MGETDALFRLVRSLSEADDNAEEAAIFEDLYARKQIQNESKVQEARMLADLEKVAKRAGREPNDFGSLRYDSEEEDMMFTCRMLGTVNGRTEYGCSESLLWAEGALAFRP